MGPYSTTIITTIITAIIIIICISIFERNLRKVGKKSEYSFKQESDISLKFYKAWTVVLYRFFKIIYFFL